MNRLVDMIIYTHGTGFSWRGCVIGISIIIIIIITIIIIGIFIVIIIAILSQMQSILFIAVSSVSL